MIPEEEYQSLVQLRPGDIFSREKLTQTTSAVSDRLGNEGYAFANVNAAPEVDTENREVAFTIFVDPGRRVYVRRINIGGNVKTRDEVVRREMRQMEGGWYDASKINRSRSRIDRLGYFDEVTVQTPAVPGTTDQVDVNFTVKERPTGNLMLGAGFSSSEKVVLSGSVSQDNLFGSGKSLSVGLNTSKSGRTMSLSFTDPYYTIDGVSLGYDLYHRTYDPSDVSSIARYKQVSTGAGIRLGYPVTEDDVINFGLAVDRSVTTTYANSPQQYLDFCTQYSCSGPNSANGVGDVTVTSLVGSIGWERDKRDSLIYPRSGNYQRVFLDAALPPGKLRYARASYQFQHWFPIRRDEALMLNAEVAYGKGYGGKTLPFYRNYYAGGIGSVRGFEEGSLGPRTADGRDSLGGNRRVIVNAEYYFPLPGSGTDRSFRMSVFADGGYVWGEGAKLQFGDMRFSTGLGFSWNSPIGPLKFSVAQPIKKGSGDETQRFQFQLGSVF